MPANVMGYIPEAWLRETGVLTENTLQQIREEFRARIESELTIGFNIPKVITDTEEERQAAMKQAFIFNRVRP